MTEATTNTIPKFEKNASQDTTPSINSKNTLLQQKIPATPVIYITYTGKYSNEAYWKELTKDIEIIIIQTISKIAEYTGFACPEKEVIILKFLDWQANKPNNYITSILQDGQLYWEIGIISENIWTKQENLSLILPKLLMSAIIKEYGKNILSLPEWLIAGGIGYTTNTGNTILDKMAISLLEDSRSFSDVILGLEKVKPIFPEAEGYLGFRFITEYYTDGKNLLKILLKNIFWEGQDWQEQWKKVLQMSFFEWQEKSKNFSLITINKIYQPLLAAYRRTLRLYLQQEYLSAIPEFKKLTLETPNSFIIGNVWFWLAMCYYRNQQYTVAIEYFGQVEKFAARTIYLAEANYRKALCYFHQNQLAKAVQQWQFFCRDYPQHDLIPSALFFLGQSFEQQKQDQKAAIYYEKMLQYSPQHSRAKAAIIALINLSIKLEWIQTGLQYCQLALQSNNLSESEKQELEKQQKTLESAQENSLSESTVKKWERCLEKFADQSYKEKQEIILELGRIGKLAIPWMEKILSQLDDENLEDTMLLSISQLEGKYAIPILWKILQHNPKKSQVIFEEFIRKKIPIPFIENMLAEQISSMSTSEKNKIQEIWKKLLWNTTEEIREKFPKLLLELNGITENNIYQKDRIHQKEILSQQQCNALSQLARLGDESQIPVLLEIAKYGEYRAQILALEYLLVWQDSQSKSLFLSSLSEKDNQIRILSVRGLVQLQEFPLLEFEKILSQEYSSIDLKILILESLETLQNEQSWNIILSRLVDSDLVIRQKIKDLVAKNATKSLAKILATKFLEEPRPLYFYTDIVELLEKILQVKISYNPTMTQKQRKEVLAKIESKM